MSLMPKTNLPLRQNTRIQWTKHKLNTRPDQTNKARLLVSSFYRILEVWLSCQLNFKWETRGDSPSTGQVGIHEVFDEGHLQFVLPANKATRTARIQGTCSSSLECIQHPHPPEPSWKLAAPWEPGDTNCFIFITQEKRILSKGDWMVTMSGY